MASPRGQGGPAANNGSTNGNSQNTVQYGLDPSGATVEGGAGNDWIVTDGGNDTLYGYGGNDTLNAGAGDDTLYGGAGNDILMGGDGNDTLVGGAGKDKLFGGAGNDRFVFTSAEDLAGDQIFDFAAGDTLDISQILADGATYNLTQVGMNVRLTITTADGQSYSINLQHTDVQTVQGGIVEPVTTDTTPPVADVPPPPPPPANSAPTAAADSASMTEDASVSFDVLANDSDADGDALTVTNATVTSGLGSASIVGGQVVYAAGGAYNYLAAGETATVTIQYTIDDGNGGTATSTATVTVTGTNDGPSAVADGASTTEDASVSFDVLANDSDPDASDTLTVTNATVTGGLGSASVVGGQVVYSAGGAYNYLAVGETATVTIQYTIDDGNGGSVTSTATVTVTGTNDGPIALADSASTTEDASVSIDVLANDSDPDASDTLTVTNATVTGGLGSASVVGGQVVYDAGGAYNYLAVGETATVTIEYTINDGNGGSVTSTATVTVTGTNDGPSAVADTATTLEDDAVSIDVLANDSDPDASDTLTVTNATVTGGLGSASVVGGQVVYSAGGAYNYLAVGETATVTIEYTIDDGNGGTTTGTATVTVTGTNDIPTAVADSTTTTEDATVSIDVLANDSDPDTSDTLTVTNAMVTSGLGSVSVVGGQLVYDPAGSYNGLAVGETATVTIEYTIDDGNGGTSTATTTVTITGSNDGPVAINDTGTTAENAMLTMDVLANDSDVDGDTLTITGATVTGGLGTVSIVNGQLVYDPAGAYDSLNSGETAFVTIEYTIDDGNGGTSMATASVMVTGVDSATGGGSTFVSAGADVITPTTDPVTGLLEIDLSSYETDTGGAKFVTFDSDVNSAGYNTTVGTIDATGYTGVQILGGAGADYMDFSGTELINIAAINGGGGNDTIIGSYGDDVIIGGRGNDTLDGGEGSDLYLMYNGDAPDYVFDSGTTGYDVIQSADGLGNIGFLSGFDASNGIEEIDGNGGAFVEVYGTEAGETLDFSTTVLTDIYMLSGYGGDDVMSGSQGNDTIWGGDGADTLTGNAGADTFVYYWYGEAGDTITDFTYGEDKIDLTYYGADSITLVQNGDDAIVQVTDYAGTHDLVTLQGVGDTSTWTEADWLL